MASEYLSGFRVSLRKLCSSVIVLEPDLSSSRSSVSNSIMSSALPFPFSDKVFLPTEETVKLYLTDTDRATDRSFNFLS